MRFVHRLVGLLAAMTFTVAAAAQDRPAANVADQSTQTDAVAARIFSQEAKLVETMRAYSPLVETYIQNLVPDKDLGMVPQDDHYFLGRMVLSVKGVRDLTYLR